MPAIQQSAAAGGGGGGGISEAEAQALVDSGVAAVVDASPATLNTLNELAAALGDDADFAATLATLLAAKAPLASPTFTGTPTAPLWVPSGLTGATAASRFVGATTSGAPATGTFAVGDVVVDRAGQVWVCTVAGSPGTWIASGAGRELGYAEVTSNQATITGIGTANKVAATGLSVTVTVGSRPIKIIARTGNSFNGTADNGIGIGIVDTADTATLLAQASGISPIANGGASLHCEARENPAAGSKTYAVYTWAVVGGSATLAAGAQNPAFIQVVEV